MSKTQKQTALSVVARQEDTLREHGGRIRLSKVARVKSDARYDTAQTTEENRRHFSAVDALAADAANSLGVRVILRNRCRYVRANNSRVKGMIRTLMRHTVGPAGPRLQLQLGPSKQMRTLSDRLEASFSRWAKEVKLAKKLRIIRGARVDSGEIFAVMGINPRLNHEIKLDFRLIETDRVTNYQSAYPLDLDEADGVFFDEWENPTAYRILNRHPGSMFRIIGANEYVDYPENLVLHFFEAERPEQHRGIPDITPAVQLFEEGRRFRAAVLAASETAADFAMVIQSESPAGDDDDTAPDPMDEIELKRRLATVLPAGWKLAQTKAEQPTTTYKEFAREILAEAARCLDMPLSLATLDANDANMSSSYVINQPYENAIETDRNDLEASITDPLLDNWLTLAFRGESPISRRIPDEFPHRWFWPLIGNHADPSRVATGQSIRLDKNLTTLSREYAKEGLDWETELRQRAKEKKLQEELGLTDAEVLPTQTNDDADAGDDPELDRIKAEADAYGVAVRAGVISPQEADEKSFRNRLGLPPMSTDVAGAWKKDKGVRRPITLAPPPGEAKQFPAPTPIGAADEDDDSED